jgi:hypothetical protein
MYIKWNGDFYLFIYKLYGSTEDLNKEPIPASLSALHKHAPLETL